MKQKVAIIGGGAAGLMTAINLAAKGLDFKIHLFEKTERLGLKIAISGGGRCNLSTGIRNRQELLSKYPRGAELLKTALGKFSPKATFEWFETHRLPLKTEEDLRVFPKSNQGEDVVKILKQNLGSTEVHYNEAIQSLTRETSGFCITTIKDSYSNFDYLVLATGGQAYAQTGSSGDGYSLAKSLGHTITELAPSLNSFETLEKWSHKLSGLVLPKARIGSQSGSLLFTHFGISGPLTFAYSAHSAFQNLPQSINLIPNTELDFEHLDKQIIADLQSNPSKQIVNIFSNYIPRKLCQELLENPEQKAAEFTKESRGKFVKLLKQGIIFTLNKRRPGDEFVTAGGITSSEINPKTLESKLIPGLFFAGEILNYDGVTGGFNLQAAWSTGSLVAKSISS